MPSNNEMKETKSTGIKYDEELYIHHNMLLKLGVEKRDQPLLLYK